MEDERWELLSEDARVARLEDALGAFGAVAELGRENKALRPHTAYTYPTSLGEWLGHAVELAGEAMWQAPFIPLLLPDGHEEGYPPVRPAREITRAQGAEALLTFGAALWSALLEIRGIWDDDDARAAARSEVIDDARSTLDEVRAESDGFPRALGALGAAVFIFAAHVERGGSAPQTAITAKLVDALAWLTAAVASTDVLPFAQLADSAPD